MKAIVSGLAVADAMIPIASDLVVLHATRTAGVFGTNNPSVCADLREMRSVKVAEVGVAGLLADTLVTIATADVTETEIARREATEERVAATIGDVMTTAHRSAAISRATTPHSVATSPEMTTAETAPRATSRLAIATINRGATTEAIVTARGV